MTGRGKARTSIRGTLNALFTSYLHQKLSSLGSLPPSPYHPIPLYLVPFFKTVTFFIRWKTNHENGTPAEPGSRGKIHAVVYL